MPLTEEQQKIMDQYLREKYPHLEWDKKADPKPWKDGDPDRRGKKDRRKKKERGFFD